MPPLPDHPELLLALFREATSYIDGLEPVLRGLRALDRFEADPSTNPWWDEISLRHLLDDLARRRRSITGMDLLKKYVGVEAMSLQDLADEHEAAHRQAC